MGGPRCMRRLSPIGPIDAHCGAGAHQKSWNGLLKLTTHPLAPPSHPRRPKMDPSQLSTTLDSLDQQLNSSETPLAQRFRALFTLKSLGGHRAIDIIGKGQSAGRAARRTGSMSEAWIEG